MLWIDAEVHLLAEKWCRKDFYPLKREKVLRKVIYDHPDRDKALARATVEGLLAEMEKAGIDKCVIMGMPWADPKLCWENNDYIANCVKKYPEKFTGIGILPNPHLEDSVDSVKRMTEEYGFKGVKVIPYWHKYKLSDPIIDDALKEMVKLNLFLVPHTDHLINDPVSSDTAYTLLQTVSNNPNLKVLAPHLGGLLCLYSLHSSVKPLLRNILFVATVPTTIRMVNYAIDSVGAENIAFGSDFPFTPAHDQITIRQDIESLNLSKNDLKLIAAKNISKFLNME